MCKTSEIFMQRALQLAAEGWGNVSPNPLVGSVIVSDNQIIAEGFHKGLGLDHAEVAAIKNAGEAASGSTLYVNMEPCCHHGRTPPCTDAIINSGIRRVVYGMKDPNPKVNGNGNDILMKAGIEVVGPVLENECKSLNRIYTHWVETGKPYIISKVAISLDGKIATAGGNSKWITNEKCRERIHYWRGGVDAILVGAETVRRDNPLLNARGSRDVTQPRPVVITASGDLDVECNLWDRERSPIVFCKENSPIKNLIEKGVDVVVSKSCCSSFDWDFIIEELGKRGVTSVLVEGGGNVHAQLVKENLSQYMIASLSTKLLGADGREWLPGLELNDVSESPRIAPDQIIILDDNVIIEGEVNY